MFAIKGAFEKFWVGEIRMKIINNFVSRFVLCRYGNIHTYMQTNNKKKLSPFWDFDHTVNFNETFCTMHMSRGSYMVFKKIFFQENERGEPKKMLKECQFEDIVRAIFMSAYTI